MTNQSAPRFRAVSAFDEADGPGPLNDDRVSLATAFLTLWHYRFTIILATLLGGAIGYVMTHVVDKTYEARATVFVTAPTFSTELTPQPFSVEAYERLAQSDFIRNRVSHELRAKNVLGANESPGEFSTSLYPSREPQKPYLPLIDLIARAHTPQLAQAVANTWASVLVVEQSNLAVLGKASSVDFILQEFPKASNRVLDAEQKLKAEETQLDRELTVAKAREGADTKKVRLEALEKNVLVRAEAELFEVRVDLMQGRQRLKQLEDELAKTKPVLTLTKGPSDEALWSATVQGQGPTGNAALGKLLIRTEEVNPVHLTLSQQVADERVAVSGLETRERTLTEQIQQARKTASALRTDFLTSENQIVALEREQSAKLAPYLMAVEEAKARFTKLEQKIGDAQIAKAESDSDVKIGARAELPVGAVSPSVKKYVAVSMLLAFVASIVALWVLSYGGLLHPAGARVAPQPATQSVTP